MVGDTERLNLWCETLYSCSQGGVEMVWGWFLLRKPHSRAFSLTASSCGICHMASPFTSLPRTAIPIIFSEVLLSTSRHQLPQALAASLLKHIIILPLQQALFHATSCVSPAITDALLTTAAPLPSPFAATLIQLILQPFPAWQASRKLWHILLYQKLTFS